MEAQGKGGSSLVPYLQQHGGEVGAGPIPKPFRRQEGGRRTRPLTDCQPWGGGWGGGLTAQQGLGAVCPRKWWLVGTFPGVPPPV